MRSGRATSPTSSTDEGWLYLAALKDVFTCEIVGYAMAARMTTELVSRALFRAVQHKHPSPGLVHHTDRGSTILCQSLSRPAGAVRHGDVDVSQGKLLRQRPIESFWVCLNSELVHHRRFATRAEAQAAIREYIEIFYNRQRRHSRLGYLAPAEFAKRYRDSAAAA